MAQYIGIDLGTSSVKLVLTTEKGTILREASREYTILQPHEGFKEISANTWWEAVDESLTELLTDADSMQIKGIGVTGQMHSLVLLDERGEEIRPVLLWNDTRTRDMIASLKEQIASTDVSYISSIISTGSPAANLLWVREQEPENFRKIRKFLIGPDFLVYKLTGNYQTDFCEASTSSLYDLLQKKWSKSMLEIVGITEDICPVVSGSAEIAGSIRPELAKRYGLHPDTKVIVGTGDNPAASIPTGCLGKGYPVLSLGTSAVLMFPRTAPDFIARGKNILFSFDGENCYTLTQGVIQSCGLGYNWLIRDVFERQEFNGADQDIDIERLGENKLLFYPHLTGDKTIYQNPSLRGAFLGLGTDTSRSDMVQAYMEGIAFALKQLIGVMALAPEAIKDLKIIGGGSKSRIWMQIIADILDTSIIQIEGNAGAGFGMALLAAYACGEIESVEEIAEQAVSAGEIFYPRRKNAALYREQYKRYLRIHDCMKQIFE